LCLSGARRAKSAAGFLVSARPNGLVFYVSAVMAVNLYGKDYPELFGTLGASLYTLFTIMTLEGWTNDVVNPIMSRHPHAWLFFIPFIVVTIFWVLNLFIGIIVNAMQEEHAKEEAEMVHDETMPILRAIEELKADVAALRAGRPQAALPELMSRVRGVGRRFAPDRSKWRALPHKGAGSVAFCTQAPKKRFVRESPREPVWR
jgi:hypothetical protein